MPRIPKADIEVGPIGRAGAVQVNASSYARGGENVIRMGKTFAEIEQKFKQLRFVSEVTREVSELRQWLNQKEQEAAVTPDLWDFSRKVQKEVARRRFKIQASRMEPEKKIALLNELDRESKIRLFNINKILRQRQIEHAKGQLLANLDQLKQEYYTSGTPAERQKILNDVKRLISANVDVGLLTQEKAQQLLSAFRKDAVYGLAQYDLQLNPEQTVERIKKGEYGLEPEEKAKLLEIGERLIRQKEKEKQEEISAKIRALDRDLYLKLLNGTLDLEDVHKAVEVGLDPKRADWYVKRITATPKESKTSPVPYGTKKTEGTDLEAYFEARKVLPDMDREQATDYLLDLAKQGKIKENEAKSLLSYWERINGQKLKEIKKAVADELTNWAKANSAVFFSKNVVDSADYVVNKFLSAVQDVDDPKKIREIGQEIKRSVIYDLFPQMEGERITTYLYANGKLATVDQTKTDAFVNYVIEPDGTVKVNEGPKYVGESVYVPELDLYVGVPAGLPRKRIEKYLSRFVAQKKKDWGVDENKIAIALESLGYGVRSAEAGLAKGFGGITEMAGEGVKRWAKFLRRTVDVEEYLIKSGQDRDDILSALRRKATGFSAKALTKLGDILQKKGHQIAEHMDELQRDMQKEMMDEKDIPPAVKRLMFYGGNAVGSFGAGVVAFLLTKNPYAVASLYASQAVGEGWHEMSKRGKKESEKILNAIPRFVGDFAINAIEFNILGPIWHLIPKEVRARGIKSAFIWALENVGKTGLIEGVQEGVENLYLNLMDKIGYDHTRNLFSGLIESMVGGFVGGGLIGTMMTPLAKLHSTMEMAQMTDEAVQEVAEEIGKTIEEKPEIIESALEDVVDRQETEAVPVEDGEGNVVGWTYKPYEEGGVIIGKEPKTGFSAIYGPDGKPLSYSQIVQQAREKGEILPSSVIAFAKAEEGGREEGIPPSQEEQPPSPERRTLPSQEAVLPQESPIREVTTRKDGDKGFEYSLNRILPISLQGSKQEVLSRLNPEERRFLREGIDTVYDLFAGALGYRFGLYDDIKHYFANEYSNERYFLYKNAKDPQVVETLVKEVRQLKDQLRERLQSALGVSGQTLEALESKLRLLPKEELAAKYEAIRKEAQAFAEELIDRYKSLPKDSPEASAIYFFLENLKATASGAVDMSGGKAFSQGIISKKGIKIPAKLREAERVLQSLNRALQDVILLEGEEPSERDGWKKMDLLREKIEAGEVDPTKTVVLVDPLYLQSTGKKGTYAGAGIEDITWEGHKENLEKHLLPLVETGVKVIYTNNADPKLLRWLNEKGFKYTIHKQVGKGRDEVFVPINFGRVSEGGRQGGKAEIGTETGRRGINLLSSKKGSVDISPIVKTLSPVVQRTLTNLAEDINDSIEAFRIAFAPHSLTQEAQRAGYTIREQLAREKLAEDRYVRDSVQRERFFDALPRETRIDFMSAVEEGREFADERLNKLATYYRKVLDTAYSLSKKWDLGIEYIENYFPHIWENPKKAREFLDLYFAKFGGRRKYRENFAKHRDIDLIKAGLEYGLKLKYTNPERIVRIRLFSAMRAALKADVLQKLVERGLATTERVSDEQVVIRQPGGIKYYTTREVARLFERTFIDEGLFGRKDVIGEVSRSALALKNTLTAIKLSLSGFHFFMVSLVDVASHAQLAGYQLARGDVKSAVKTLSQSLLGSFKLGSELDRILLSGPQNEEEKMIYDTLMMAGARRGMPEEYRVNVGGTIKEAIEKGDIAGTVGLFVSSIARKIQGPLMEVYVPRLKLANFWIHYSDWLKSNPHATMEEKQAFASQLWDSIDNRFGEMVYDNMFWQRAFRDAGVVSLLSLGWNLGTVRETGNAFIDLVKIGQAIKEGKQISRAMIDRTAFIASYVAVVGLFGALTTKLLTGEWPEKVIDFFYPRTGRYNPDGSEVRITIPAYSKDFFSMAEAIRKEGIVRGPAVVLSHKLAPVWSTMADIIRNQDFYGAMIYEPDSPLPKQVLDSVLYFVQAMAPISLSSASSKWREVSLEKEGMVDRLVSYILSPEFGLSVLGFTRAPAYVTRSKLQNKIYDLLVRKFGGVKATRDEIEARKIRKVLEQKLRLGMVDDRLLYNAIKSGALGSSPEAISRTLKRLAKNAKLPPDVVAFKRLNNEDKARLWLMMNDEERVRYYPAMSEEAKRLVIEMKLREVRNGNK